MAGVPDQKDRLSTSPAFDDISNIDDIANIPALSNLIDLDPDLTTSSSEIDEPNKAERLRKLYFQQKKQKKYRPVKNSNSNTEVLRRG